MPAIKPVGLSELSGDGQLCTTYIVRMINTEAAWNRGNQPDRVEECAAARAKDSATSFRVTQKS